MESSMLAAVGWVARFQSVRLLFSPRWAAGAAGALLIALYEGHQVAGLPAMNQWDVVWLGWNYLQLDVPCCFPVLSMWWATSCSGIPSTRTAGWC